MGIKDTFIVNYKFNTFTIHPFFMSSLTISLIQSALHWEDPAANRKNLEEKIRSIRERTEVVVLPEMFSTGFSMDPQRLAETMDGPTVKWMKAISAEKKIILTGSLIIKEGEEYFNRLLWVLPNGQVGVYDKRHLFAYAGEHEQYTPGHKRLIASVKGWKVQLLVCYDLRFPVWARQQSTEEGPEYDLLIYVANWPAKRAHAWKSLLTARAIENQCYVIGLNRVGEDGNGHYYSGDSLVIDPLGQTLFHRADEEAIYTITLEKETLDQVRTQMPFWKDGDPFLLSL